jgi:hypothetical protein
MRHAHKEATTTVKIMMLVAIPWTTSVKRQTPENPKKVPEPKQFTRMAAASVAVADAKVAKSSSVQQEIE